MAENPRDETFAAANLVRGKSYQFYYPSADHQLSSQWIAVECTASAFHTLFPRDPREPLPRSFESQPSLIRYITDVLDGAPQWPSFYKLLAPKNESCDLLLFVQFRPNLGQI